MSVYGLTNKRIQRIIIGNLPRNRAEFITVISLICFVAFMVFRSLHFDYDKNLVENLTPADRRLLERASTPSVKKKLKSK